MAKEVIVDMKVESEKPKKKSFFQKVESFSGDVLAKMDERKQKKEAFKTKITSSKTYELGKRIGVIKPTTTKVKSTAKKRTSNKKQKVVKSGLTTNTMSNTARLLTSGININNQTSKKEKKQKGGLTALQKRMMS